MLYKANCWFADVLARCHNHERYITTSIRSIYYATLSVTENDVLVMYISRYFFIKKERNRTIRILYKQLMTDNEARGTSNCRRANQGIEPALMGSISPPLDFSVLFSVVLLRTHCGNIWHRHFQGTPWKLLSLFAMWLTAPLLCSYMLYGCEFGKTVHPVNFTKF